MRKLVQTLDSALLSRAGNAITLWTLVGFGAAVVLAVGLVGADVMHIAGWIPIVCFGLWTLTSLVLVASWMARRSASTICSPVDELLTKARVPASSAALLRTLVAAESQGREFIADAAIVNPLDDLGRVVTLVSRYQALEEAVDQALASSTALDDRWTLLWRHKPTWAREHLLDAPYTRAHLDEVVRYMALRNRQVRWMIECLQGGGDRPVRYIRHWVAALEIAARS